VGGLLAIVFGLCLLLLDMGKIFRDASYDLPFLTRSHKQVDDVVIIYLDEKSYAILKQDPADFDRSLHTRLLKRLQADGAKLVVMDLLWIDSNRPITDADRELAATMKAYGTNRVVLGGQYHEDDHLGIINHEIRPPIDLFRDAANWGLAIISRDTDWVVRQHHPGTEQIPSLAWKAAELIGADITKDPEKRGENRWLNYYSRKAFVGIPYAYALEGTLPAGFSFSNKVVFVGWGNVTGYTEIHKQFKYPWTWLYRDFPYGVEIHALTFANLVHGDWMRRMPVALEFLIIVLLGATLGYWLSRFRPLTATITGILAALAITVLACMIAAQMNVWFSWTVIVAAQVPVALVWSYIFHSIRSYIEIKELEDSLNLSHSEIKALKVSLDLSSREIKDLESSLSLYLSRKGVREVLKQPELLKAKIAKKEVSVLFTDIEGFTDLSTLMPSNDLMNLLNAYYGPAIPCIHETDGTVINLIGDAILAIWNAPQDQENHQELACRSALFLKKTLDNFEDSTGQPLATRAGLHCGDVSVGNIGSPAHFQYTVIGKNVNLASRLESLNKKTGTRILATRYVLEPTGDKFVSRLVGYFTLKGFGEAVQVHELIGETPADAATSAYIDLFKKAHGLFVRQKWDEAEEAFRHVLLTKADDGPTKYYLKEVLPEFRVLSIPSGWRGQIELSEK
jgi:adenylate cyclase